MGNAGTDAERKNAPGTVTFRAPRTEDGAQMWRIVRDSGVLDPNSGYAYLLWCRHFDRTSILAQVDGDPVGFVTGFRPPAHPDVLFVWQVGVDEKARGRGVASRMILELLARDGCQGVRFIETTVTPSNGPSQALFRGLARRLQTGCNETTGFPARIFPDTAHEEERLFRIGPFDRERARSG